MDEWEITVAHGPVRTIPVLSPLAGGVVLSGPARLHGYSFREAGFSAPSESEGAVVAPAAGAIITSVVPAGSGTYQIAWTVELVGAAAAADLNNFGLYAGATLLETSLNAAAAGQYPQVSVEHVNPFAVTYAVKAIGAGTAGVTYAAQLAIQPITGVLATLELQDNGNAIAEISAGTGQVDTKWFGDVGIHVRGLVKTNPIAGFMTGVVYAAYHRGLQCTIQHSSRHTASGRRTWQ